MCPSNLSSRLFTKTQRDSSDTAQVQGEDTLSASTESFATLSSDHHPRRQVSTHTTPDKKTHVNASTESFVALASDPQSRLTRCFNVVCKRREYLLDCSVRSVYPMVADCTRTLVGVSWRKYVPDTYEKQ